MKRTRFSEERIIGVLKEAEAGAKTGELAPRHGVSEATIYNWKAKYGGLEVLEAMRDELLNETLFLDLDHARTVIAAWAEDYNQARSHSALGYETPAAFAAELHKRRPAQLRPSGSAARASAYTALMRNKAAGL